MYKAAHLWPSCRCPYTQVARPCPEDARLMPERTIALVNTSVTTQETNTAIINGSCGNSYLTGGRTDGLQTPEPLLAKPR